MVCAQRGYNCVVCMAEPFSVERRKIMRMLGAKVIVTPKAGKGTGMVAKAEELCEKHGWFLCRQFENDANPAFHASTTGPEILTDFAGKKLDYFVTGYGTGGTFQGVGRVIKAARPDTKIVLLEPEAASLIASGTKTERKSTGAPLGSHPAFAAHPIQGWTPDFIPKVLEDAPMPELMEELVPIPGAEAIATSKALAAKEAEHVAYLQQALDYLKAEHQVAKEALEADLIAVTKEAEAAEELVQQKEEEIAAAADAAAKAVATAAVEAQEAQEEKEAEHAAAMAVISALSYAGLTSTRSIPTKVSASSPRISSNACQLASPPLTGVPVPGAKAGSSASISKVR